MLNLDDVLKEKDVVLVEYTGGTFRTKVLRDKDYAYEKGKRYSMPYKDFKALKEKSDYFKVTGMDKGKQGAIKIDDILGAESPEKVDKVVGEISELRDKSAKQEIALKKAEEEKNAIAKELEALKKEKNKKDKI